MDPTARRQSLREHLGHARDALERGDAAEALAAIDRALMVDPDYLAAQALKERILRQPAVAPSSAAPRAEPRAPIQAASPSGATAMASALLRVEARTRARRIEKRTDAARAALAHGRTQEARAAIDEIAAIDPEHPEYPLLLAELQARTLPTRRRTHAGPAVAAIVACAALTTAGWMWLEQRGSAPPTAVVQPAPAAERPVPPAPAGVEPVPATVAAEARTVESVPPAASERRVPAAAPEARAAGTTGSPIPESGTQVERIEQIPFRPQPSPEPPPAQVQGSQPLPAIAPAEPSEPSQLPGALIAPPQDARLRSVEPAREVAEMPRPGDPAPVPTTPVVREEDLVLRALQQYRRAYDTLDARAAQAVWPGVDSAALQRAFDGLASQRLTFQSCQLQVNGVSASAECRGTAQYTPRVGSRDARDEPRNWRFSLRKTTNNTWQIESARVAR